MAETTRTPSAMLAARGQMGTTFVGIANTLVLEGAPNTATASGRMSYAVKYLGQATTTAFYIIRVKLTPTSIERPLKWDGTSASAIDEVFYINNILGADTIPIWGICQVTDITKYNVEFTAVKCQYLAITKNANVNKIYVKRNVDASYIEYTANNAIFAEVGEGVKGYAIPASGYDITGGHVSPATAETITIADVTGQSYAPTAYIASKKLSIVINNGVAKVWARKVGGSWSAYTTDTTITGNVGDTFQACANPSEGFAIDAGYATSIVSPDVITLDTNKTYAPTATALEVKPRIGAEIYGNITKRVSMLSQGVALSALTSSDANKPATIEGYGQRWELVDDNNNILLSGIRQKQECGKIYGFFEWVSREGAMKRHVFEIRNQRRAATPLQLFTLNNNFDVRKAQNFGFVGYIDGLCDYDKWYYSDIVTSSLVRFSFDGLTNWRVVNVMTNDVDIYTGQDNQVFEFDVEFANYTTL